MKQSILILFTLVVGFSKLLTANTHTASTYLETTSCSTTTFEITKKKKRRKYKKLRKGCVSKFLGSKRFEKDGAKTRYLNGFDLGVKPKHIEFYIEPKSKEIILYNTKKNTYRKTGDYL